MDSSAMPPRPPQDVARRPASSLPAARRDRALLLLGWLVAVGVMTWIATRDLAAPGLYYEEATYPAQARDFLRGTWHAHMPGSMVVPFLGRPFPLFAQPYLGALKAWLTMPALALFGATTPVVRLASLGWAALALLLFMLWARQLLGVRGAVVAGTLLALDPSFFFMTLYDWGPVVPGYLARLGGFVLATCWWRRRRWETAFLAGVCFGLGMYHKLDFAAVLAGAAAAAVIAGGREVLRALPRVRRQLAVAAAGFLLGMGPMLWRAWWVATTFAGDTTAGAPAPGVDKLHLQGALYDGSYLLRAITVGGDLDRVFEQPAAASSAFGLLLLLSILVLAVVARVRPERRRLALFAVSGLAATTLAVLLLPGAYGIHHALLAYPWPHLVVALAVVQLLELGTEASASSRRVIASLLVLAVLAGHLRVLLATQRLLERTGGRGYWSAAITDFAREVRTRDDLTIVSLDWGFNEQLILLTDGPQLRELFWHPPPPGQGLEDCASPDRVYLAHPPEWTTVPVASPFLHGCRTRNPAARMLVRPYRDREGRVAFYAIRFATLPQRGW